MQNKLLIVIGLISPVITMALLLAVHRIPINDNTGEGHLFFLSSWFAVFACRLGQQYREAQTAKPPTRGWAPTSCTAAYTAVVFLVIFELVRLTPFRPTQPVTMTIFAAMLLLFGILTVLMYSPNTRATSDS